MNILLSTILILLMYMSLWYLYAQWKKDNTWADCAWSLGFVLIAWLTLLLSQNFLTRPLLVTILVTIWGIRLASHIFMRHRGHPEDWRYQQLRQQWGTQEPIKSFLYIFMLQGFLMLCISSSVIMINSYSVSSWTLFDFIGLSIWILGFIFEVVGDYQLKQFLKDPFHKGKIMDQGLWHYTRHPNYFGESSMWWGIWIMALSVPYGWITVISPLLITYLLMYISGVPLAEQPFIGNSEYEKYKGRTNEFFPWFSKK